MKYYIIDTNVIVSYLIRDNSILYQKASHFFKMIESGEARAYLEQTVLTEVVYILYKTYNIPRQQIALSLLNILMLGNIINTEKDVLISALKLYLTTNLSIVDCLIATKCTALDVDVMTFDKKLNAIVKPQKKYEFHED